MSTHPVSQSHDVKVGIMSRVQAWHRIEDEARWDIAVIGGGATGLGIAVDAASRGYSTVLFERGDFGQGTSSRSTKLIHGGVRYLPQGRLGLVREALRERSLLLRNAPHIVSNREFLVPAYAWWESPYYGIGLKLYGLLAGRHGLGASRRLSRTEVLDRVPTLVQDHLRGGVSYRDGQFDDARLLVALARTAVEAGACVINYANVVALNRHGHGRITGVLVRDELTQSEQKVAAACIINATGPFCDAVRQMDDPGQPAIVAPSQGTHLVVSRDFLPGSTAVLIPRTNDGRVLFAIPWQGHTVIGTTDTAIPAVVPEPRPLNSEIAYLLEMSHHFLQPAPTAADVLSVFVGIRPLVKQSGNASTAALSREHHLEVSPSGLLTITGGKWTSYRQMAEDTVDEAARLAGLPQRPCRTRDLHLSGFHDEAEQFGNLAAYGADAPAVLQLADLHPEWAEPLHPTLPITGAQIAWGARQEMAQTLEDVLARRTRALFVNAQTALAVAPACATILARELGRDSEWVEAQLTEFRAVAARFMLDSAE